MLRGAGGHSRAPSEGDGRSPSSDAGRTVPAGGRGARTQALLTSMFCICSSSTRALPPPAFFLPPSCCFFCFLESSCSMGAGRTNRISSRRSAWGESGNRPSHPPCSSADPQEEGGRFGGGHRGHYLGA